MVLPSNQTVAFDVVAWNFLPLMRMVPLALPMPDVGSSLVKNTLGVLCHRDGTEECRQNQKTNLFHFSFYLLILLFQITKQVIQTNLVEDQHLTRLTTHSGTYDTSLLQLIHQTTGAVVADGKLALDE